MRTTFGIAAAFILATPIIASARDAAITDTPLNIKNGTLVVSGDGKIVGEVQRVLTSGGSPSSVSVIYDSRFVQIPVASLTASDKRLVASLTLADIRKLK